MSYVEPLPPAPDELAVLAIGLVDQRVDRAAVVLAEDAGGLELPAQHERGLAREAAEGDAPPACDAAQRGHDLAAIVVVLPGVPA
jgi:hypothetical protein